MGFRREDVLKVMRRELSSSGRSGQALAELALIFPIILVLLSAIVEFGFYYQRLSRLQAAAAVGARVGASGGDNAAVTQAVNNARGSIALVAGSPTITVLNSSGTVQSPNTLRTTGFQIRVDVSAPYSEMTLVSLTRAAGISQITATSTYPITN